MVASLDWWLLDMLMYFVKCVFFKVNYDCVYLFICLFIYLLTVCKMSKSIYSLSMLGTCWNVWKPSELLWTVASPEGQKVLKCTEHVWFAMPLLDLSAIPRDQMHYIYNIYIYNLSTLSQGPMVASLRASLWSCPSWKLAPANYITAGGNFLSKCAAGRSYQN